MMNYFFYFLLISLLILFIYKLNLKKQIENLLYYLAEIFNLFLDTSLNEKAQEKKILHSLLRLIINLIQLVSKMAFIFLFTYVFSSLIYYYFKINIFPLLINPYLNLVIIILSFFYFILFKKSNNNFSMTTKFIFRVVLGNNYILRLLFKINRRRKVNNTCKLNKCIFISGLARSGTTSLLNDLFSTGSFSSAKYSDLPFLTYPNLFNFFKTKKKVNNLIDRKHNDGIKYSLNSPEAFDEIFWRIFLQKKYIKKKYLKIHNISKEILSYYNIFINFFLLNDNKNFYITKNNNNLLRLNSLSKYFKESLFIFCIRDPVQHSESLMRQHHNFVKLHKKDSFNLEYMNFLSHYEFGLNHKYFYLGSGKNKYLKNTVNYWLYCWYEYYSYLYQNLDRYSNVYILDHTKYCLNKDYYIRSIQKKLNIVNSTKFNNDDFYLNLNRVQSSHRFDSNLLAKARRLYFEINKNVKKL